MAKQTVNIYLSEEAKAIIETICMHLGDRASVTLSLRITNNSVYEELIN